VILAAICTNGGHYDEAFRYLARSRAIADSLGDLKKIATNHHSVGRIHREMGDTVTAIDYELRALALYREIKDLSSVDGTMRHLGMLYSCLGKADSAMYYYNAALELAKRLGQRGRLRSHYEELARHYARMKKFSEAITFQRRYMALADSVYNVETVQRINELSAAYEADRRERAIAMHEAERGIDSLELLRRGQALTEQRMLLHRRQQEKTLLAQDDALQRLRLARAEDTLSMRADAITRGRAESAKEQRWLQLQQASIARNELYRNTLLGGLGVTLLLTLLFLRALRNRRIAAELRTEAAELRVSAAEAMAAKQQAEIARRENEMQRRFTARLIASQEQERKRIAGALHDGIGQDLLIIKHRALMALEDAEQRRQHLGDITHIAVEAVEDVRRLCRDLCPYQLERVGLTNTLRDMLASVGKSTALTMHAEIDEVDGLIPAEREIDLYRVVQEGINNVIRHAEAHEVEVTLRRVNGSLCLRIHDDGRGFDPAWLSSTNGEGLGVQDMTERMHLLGGELRFESSVGSGTLVEASIPLTAVTHHQQESAA
ncbi:MAG: tetratricopeptide repeat protein, partial [Bacteroidetes bacterium]|nr:tetratricopeptide repeat protein [Bacteroidota bacterium]